ncbi:MAG: hypothetical protein JWP25_8587 [Bradyrhizobium sp.]|nr:hypothetical protein [Bradyrhizobium sp.]
MGSSLSSKLMVRSSANIASANRRIRASCRQQRHRRFRHEYICRIYVDLSPSQIEQRTPRVAWPSPLYSSSSVSLLPMLQSLLRMAWEALARTTQPVFAPLSEQLRERPAQQPVFRGEPIQIIQRAHRSLMPSERCSTPRRKASCRANRASLPRDIMLGDCQVGARIGRE